MKPNIYEYSSYRQYLKDCLEANGPKSGSKARAAQALAVHTTFISQVVLGKAELSLDQAEKMNFFLGHNQEEGEFFLDLVILERATDPNLKKRFEEKIKIKYTDHVQIVKSFEKTRELAEADQEKFYSSHIYGLIHVLTSIPEYRTREALTEAVGYSMTIVNEAVDFLLKIGILKMQKNQIVHSEQHVHLKSQSKNILQHHTNWRLATVQNLAFSKPDDLHYSLTFSCSKKDAVKIRESLLKNLKSMSETIGASNEEKAYVYCFDFFEWK